MLDFSLNLRAISKYKPPGGLYLEGRFNGGFFALRVWGAYISGLLVECGKKWKIVRKILPNRAGNSAEKSEIVRENAK